MIQPRVIRRVMCDARILLGAAVLGKTVAARRVLDGFGDHRLVERGVHPPFRLGSRS